MKKIITLFLLLFFVIVMLVSCRTRELCPAYMKNNEKVTLDKRV